MNKKISQRFLDLEKQIDEIEATRSMRSSSHIAGVEVIDQDLFIGWKVKVKNLLVTACGESSQHFIAFEKGEKSRGMESGYAIMKRLRAIFFAAKEDFDGGFLISFKNLVQAEIFDSELEQAKELLSKGYKLAAAVIAGVVLETALRDLCDDNSISHSKLDVMNAQLAKAGVYNKLQQKQITAIADIRNSAAHGKPEEFNDIDVQNMIRDVEGFLIGYLK